MESRVLKQFAGLWSLAVLSSSIALADEYPARYMGGAAELATAPNGALVYDKVLQAASQVFYAEKTVEKVADGIWVIGGYSIVNCIVIEAPDGLIVYDTGDFAEEG